MKSVEQEKVDIKEPRPIARPNARSGEEESKETFPTVSLNEDLDVRPVRKGKTADCMSEPQRKTSQLSFIPPPNEDDSIF